MNLVNLQDTRLIYRLTNIYLLLFYALKKIIIIPERESKKTNSFKIASKNISNKLNQK